MKQYVILFLIALGLKCLSAFMLQNFLCYVNLFFVAGVVIWTGYRMVSKKDSFTWKKCLLILCMLAIAAIPSQTVTAGKFYLLEPVYQHAAEQIAEEISDCGNTIIKEKKLSVPARFLLNNGERAAVYSKYDTQYTISFTKHRNFFQWYAYVYFSEPEAVTQVTNPSRYWGGYDDASAYDSIEWLVKDKWALVKYY